MNKVLKDFSILVNGKDIINVGSSATCQSIMNRRQNIHDIKYDFQKEDSFDFSSILYDSAIRYLVETGYITKGGQKC